MEDWIGQRIGLPKVRRTKQAEMRCKSSIKSNSELLGTTTYHVCVEKLSQHTEALDVRSGSLSAGRRPVTIDSYLDKVLESSKQFCWFISRQTRKLHPHQGALREAVRNPSIPGPTPTMTAVLDSAMTLSCS
jgi:hypothetical protein